MGGGEDEQAGDRVEVAGFARPQGGGVGVEDGGPVGMVGGEPVGMGFVRSSTGGGGWMAQKVMIVRVPATNSTPLSPYSAALTTARARGPWT
jgi:hypothetical protein